MEYETQPAAPERGTPAADAPATDWLEAVRDLDLDDHTGTASAGLQASERRAGAAERRVAALERALTSRACIDQAKGVLMATFGVDADAAFDTLVWVSQHANVKVAAIAEQFVARARSADLSTAPQERLTQLLRDLISDSPRPAGRSGQGTNDAAR